MPEAVEVIGVPQAGLWFYVGVLFFAAVVHFIPEPSPSFLTVEGDPSPAAELAKPSDVATPDSPSIPPPSKAEQKVAVSASGTPLRRSARR